jgi:hypothetical protein
VVRGWGEFGTFVHCWWEGKMVQIRKQDGGSSNDYSSSEYTPRRIGSGVSKEYLYTYVHSNMIHITITTRWKLPKYPSRDE